MNRLATYIWIVLLPCIPAIAKAQTKPEPDRKLDIIASYGYSVPSLDMAQRFGAFHSISSGILYKNKSNFTYAFRGTYHFGYEIRENGLIDNLLNSGEAINSTTGMPAKFSLSMRGFALSGSVGKMFRLFPGLPNSGIYIEGSGGFLSHWINFNIPQHDIPALDDNHIQGYDRLSYGWMGSEFIGIMHHSYSRFLNFQAGIRFTQSNVRNVREFNYDKMAYEKGILQDRYYTLEFSWFIPVDVNPGKNSEYQFR